jgi:hypothetical protein
MVQPPLEGGSISRIPNLGFIERRLDPGAGWLRPDQGHGQRDVMTLEAANLLRGARHSSELIRFDGRSSEGSRERDRWFSGGRDLFTTERRRRYPP